MTEDYVSLKLNSRERDRERDERNRKTDGEVIAGENGTRGKSTVILEEIERGLLPIDAVGSDELLQSFGNLLCNPTPKTVVD